MSSTRNVCFRQANGAVGVTLLAHRGFGSQTRYEPKNAAERVPRNVRAKLIRKIRVAADRSGGAPTHASQAGSKTRAALAAES
jgi:hypothetical protein